MITDTQLKQIMPNLGAQKLQLYLSHLNAAMQSSGVDTMLRTAAFVAQLAHESAEFRFMEEIWGPIDAQRRYEPPADLAKRLGNTQPGDGKRFKGRGPIQITGRFNYKKYGDLLGVDLVNQPELAAQPEVAFSTAGLFWKTNGLNELADGEQFVAITKRINGGTNGLPDREKYFARAKGVLADNFIAAAFGATRGARTMRRAVVPDAPLSRGREAIVEVLGDKAPKRPPMRKVAAKKPAARAPAAKKASAKKTAVKKTVARGTAAKKSASKKSTAKKSSVARPVR